MQTAITAAMEKTLLKPFLLKIVELQNLTENEAYEAMKIIMDGQATDAQIGAFITACRMKGETIEEITGFVRAMRQKATPVHVSDPNAIDTCGTGGDLQHTLNVSTLSALAAAGAGVTVAKHGNRSVSSKCGSADLLLAFGLKIDIETEKVEECIQKAGIGFLFAPKLHQAIKNAVGPRREIGLRTFFNILGPMTNPAGVKRQVIGVFDGNLSEQIAAVLQRLGSERIFVVYGKEGLDEISICGETLITELRDGTISPYVVTPENFGFKRRTISEVTGGYPEDNKTIALEILNGKKGAGRDMVILNAGFAIAASDDSISIEEGIKRAQESLDSGKALKKLEQLIEITNAD